MDKKKDCERARKRVKAKTATQVSKKKEANVKHLELAYV